MSDIKPNDQRPVFADIILRRQSTRRNYCQRKKRLERIERVKRRGGKLLFFPNHYLRVFFKERADRIRHRAATGSLTTGLDGSEFSENSNTSSK